MAHLKEIHDRVFSIFGSTVGLTGDGLVDSEKPIVLRYLTKNEHTIKTIRRVLAYFDADKYEYHPIECGDLGCTCRLTLTKDRVMIPVSDTYLPLQETSDYQDLVNRKAIPIKPLQYEWHQIPYLPLSVRSYYCRTILDATGYEFNYELPKLEIGECPIEMDSIPVIQLRCQHTIGWSAALNILKNPNPLCPICRAELEFKGYERTIDPDVGEAWDIDGSTQRLNFMRNGGFTLEIPPGMELIQNFMDMLERSGMDVGE